MEHLIVGLLRSQAEVNSSGFVNFSSEKSRKIGFFSCRTLLVYNFRVPKQNFLFLKLLTTYNYLLYRSLINPFNTSSVTMRGLRVENFVEKLFLSIFLYLPDFPIFVKPS
ncbi:MAG: hypothetical protein WBL27_08220 [Salinimicrobium sp.]